MSVVLTLDFPVGTNPCGIANFKYKILEVSGCVGPRDREHRGRVRVSTLEDGGAYDGRRARLDPS